MYQVNLPSPISISGMLCFLNIKTERNSNLSYCRVTISTIFLPEAIFFRDTQARIRHVPLPFLVVAKVSIAAIIFVAVNVILVLIYEI